ncbi:MAG: hypothetical protein A2359_03395 [Candidatus Moranbacteria bacterium RIFOXYB1_FULL_43_19]|nr:MAG: hypothetical protein A2359_03395 [Candidatus Moranbacteria bacterium RIFOXYB1_FULL_43_19]OGI32544.1 MAG: hypothetical protein A2420_03140 [Candidatus Moranbacteria bacterium RIFOXYC1_FULL_44_13]OGI38164.1 MAG: hypothetical protein A2612_01435 [Candidatus Moranbacteria bacterium RIFOXYD1_FULL_44_12]
MNKNLPNVLVFASGTKTGGGSGFQKMVEATRLNPPVLNAKICGVISNHSAGGVWQKAKSLGILFMHWAGSFLAKDYQQLISLFDADFIMLSGWLKLVAGLEPARTINIHPGPLPRFGGPNMHGHHVHEAVMEAYRRGEIIHSAVAMHFVDEVYDRGPIFFQFPVPIEPNDTPETLAAKVNVVEHNYQSWALNLVVQGRIKLINGKVIYDPPELKHLLMPAIN